MYRSGIGVPIDYAAAVRNAMLCAQHSSEYRRVRADRLIESLVAEQ
jgi:hypothetical protein